MGSSLHCLDPKIWIPIGAQPRGSWCLAARPSPRHRAARPVQELTCFKGRSPYDEIVQGEGESDPRIPLQKYDERGRAINPETKRINKDVIRSHNEVMLVIGVAEAENEATEAQADSVRRHDQYEQRIGKTMFYVGKAVETIGIWGADGMRQRLLVSTAGVYLGTRSLRTCLANLGKRIGI